MPHRSVTILHINVSLLGNARIKLSLLKIQGPDWVGVGVIHISQITDFDHLTDPPVLFLTYPFHLRS